MTNVFFTYYKDGKIKVLNFEDANKEYNFLVENGWKHTATLDVAAWIEHLYNVSPNRYIEFLTTLTGENK